MKLNLKSLKKEEEKMEKKLNSYKKSILSLIKENYNFEIEKSSISYTLKLSELNKKSLSPYDNNYKIQIKEFVKLINSSSTFKTLYERIINYKDEMWEKYKIRTTNKFDEILEKIKKEVS